jgi:D-glycero-beta-D-manno-heptose 1-phosphate adenylyltransferase
MSTPTTFDDLLNLRAQWHEQNRRIVFTNGVFDLLHLGHLQYLQAARSFGDLLVVGLNSDASTRAIKGPLRPLVPENERAALLLGLRPVDYVTIFDDRTAERIVALIQPDVYVKGGDYAITADRGTGGKELPEARVVQAYGGRVELITYLPGHSTSELIERIVERYGN